MNLNINRKEILITISVILLLLLIFFSVKIFNSKIIIVNTNKETQDNINFKYILNSSKIEDCKFLNNPSKQKICEIKLSKCFNDSCFYEKAMISRVELDCYKIKNSTIKIKCTSNIKYNNLIQNPVLKNNVNLCNKFENKINIEKCSDNFYYVNSINKADKSLCVNIKNEVFRNECQN